MFEIIKRALENKEYHAGAYTGGGTCPLVPPWASQGTCPPFGIYGQQLKSGVVGKNEIVPICKGVFSPQKVVLKKSVLNI